MQKSSPSKNIHISKLGAIKNEFEFRFFLPGKTGASFFFLLKIGFCVRLESFNGVHKLTFQYDKTENTKERV